MLRRKKPLGCYKNKIQRISWCFKGNQVGLPKGDQVDITKRRPSRYYKKEISRYYKKEDQVDIIKKKIKQILQKDQVDITKRRSCV